MTKTRGFISALFMALLVVVSADAAPLHVKLLDQSGAGFRDVLVIVKSLEGKGEVFRALTDSQGTVPERDLAPGVYRVIATCPYGICRTKASEFLVSASPVEVGLTLDFFIRGNVVSVSIGPTDRMTVEVVDDQGQTVPGVQLLVRDSDVRDERWYKTNANGEAEVELPKGEVTFVALHGGRLKEETVSGASIGELRAAGKKLLIRF